MPNVGLNDKYLITKLRNYNVTLEKIDSYLAKLNSDNLSSLIDIPGIGPSSSSQHTPVNYPPFYNHGTTNSPSQG